MSEQRCAACGRVVPPEHQEHEYRHIGGKEDRREVYCGQGFGHQRWLREPAYRGLLPPSAA